MLSKARQKSEEDFSDDQTPPTKRINSLEQMDERRQLVNSYNDSFNETHGTQGNQGNRRNYDQDPTNKKSITSMKQKSYPGRVEDPRDK